MSIAEPRERLQIPETLRRQLDGFRRRVWTIKTIEAACAAGFGVVVAFLAMFALDRFWDTPAWPRAGLFGLAALACAIVPIALHRWVWLRRRPDQLARLLARKHPRIGDQLLGVIELSRDDSEQARSRQLVGAAIEQVAHDCRERDFRDAVPNPRHRTWLGVLAAPSVVALGLFVACPAAASNAWARLVAPWNDTPRYTFAALEPVPSRLVVPHGEPFHFAVKLAKNTASNPSRAEVRVGDREPVVAPLKDGGYEFELASQVAMTRMEIQVGDASRVVEVEPMLRPELNSVVSGVTLPEYLGRPGSKDQDVRGGSITLVKGSLAQVTATAGRELANAWVDGHAVAPEGATITSPMVTLAASRDLQFRWVDRFGLAGKEPFTLKLASRDDEAPTMMIEDLPRQKVVLDSELLNFKVRAQDDFGVKRVGLEWQGLDKKYVRSVATGERVLAAGGPDKETLDVVGAFSAKSFGIEPQPIALRVFVEDYLPGRPRVVSPPYTLFILTAEQHAIWLTEQLSKWHRQSLEVRDRELQLYETNKQIRELSPEDLDRPENRKKLDAQASAEKANGRKLSGLVMNGEDLVKQAMRNPEFGVGHLEKWAEMLQILKDISGNRMPSVADLLKQAAQAPKGLAVAPPAEKPPGRAPRASPPRMARARASPPRIATAGRRMRGSRPASKPPPGRAARAPRVSPARAARLRRRTANPNPPRRVRRARRARAATTRPRSARCEPTALPSPPNRRPPALPSRRPTSRASSIVSRRSSRRVRTRMKSRDPALRPRPLGSSCRRRNSWEGSGPPTRTPRPRPPRRRRLTRP